MLPAALLCTVQHAGGPFQDGVLLSHHPQPHGLRLHDHPCAAHPHLPLIHAVHPLAQQALLDDGHHLHGGRLPFSAPA